MTFVARLIKRLRGGSQPILVETNDRQLFVIKFSNNLQGPNLLFNESMGSELYRACGLPVPEWRPLLLSQDLIDRNPAFWLGTESFPVRPAGGICYGSRFLGGNGVELSEILPCRSFKRVINQQQFWPAFLLDQCADHRDNRQVIFRNHPDSSYQAVFIDHGHMFGGPQGEIRRTCRTARYLDKRIYPDLIRKHRADVIRMITSLNPAHLWGIVEDLPDDWKTPTAIQNLAACISCLKDRKNLTESLEAMMADLSAPPTIYGPERSVVKPTLRNSLLRCGLQCW